MKKLKNQKNITKITKITKIKKKGKITKIENLKKKLKLKKLKKFVQIGGLFEKNPQISNFLELLTICQFASLVPHGIWICVPCCCQPSTSSYKVNTNCT